MTKRKPRYTKETAAQNRAMLRRAKELLKDVDLTVPLEHFDVQETIRREFPDVTENRIRGRMAQAYRQLRYEKYFVIE